jgi:hypothetical protein
MRSGFHRQRPDKNLEKWKSLPPKEKKRQYQDLVDSPYWHLLPSEIQRRIQDLVEN